MTDSMRQLRSSSELLVTYRQMMFGRVPAMGVVAVQGLQGDATVFTPVKKGHNKVVRVKCGDEATATAIIEAAAEIPHMQQDDVGYNCAWFAGSVAVPGLITPDNCSRYEPRDWNFTSYTETPGLKRMLPSSHIDDELDPRLFPAGHGHWYWQLQNGLGMHVNGHSSGLGQGGYLVLNHVEHIREMFPNESNMFDVEPPLTVSV